MASIMGGRSEAGGGIDAKSSHADAKSEPPAKRPAVPINLNKSGQIQGEGTTHRPERKSRTKNLKEPEQALELGEYSFKYR
jgi:hypothetical protein